MSRFLRSVNTSAGALYTKSDREFSDFIDVEAVNIITGKNETKRERGSVSQIVVIDELKQRLGNSHISSLARELSNEKNKTAVFFLNTNAINQIKNDFGEFSWVYTTNS